MTVERIFIATKQGGPQVERERVTVVAGAGIEGDRHFNPEDKPGSNITLIEAEEVDAFLREQGREHDLSISHRNLVTRGVRLNGLVGKEFLVGTVRMRGVQLCEPCLGLGRALASPDLPAADVVARFLHRAGLRADAVTSGPIVRGAPISQGS